MTKAEREAEEQVAREAAEAKAIEDAKVAAALKKVEDKKLKKERKQARKKRRKVLKKRWRMGLMATLLDDSDGDYDDIDEYFVDGVPMPERDWDSDDSAAGLFDAGDPRANLYRTADDSSEGSFYSTDSDELDRELQMQRRVSEWKTVTHT